MRREKTSLRLMVVEKKTAKEEKPKWAGLKFLGGLIKEWSAPSAMLAIIALLVSQGELGTKAKRADELDKVIASKENELAKIKVESHQSREEANKLRNDLVQENIIKRNSGKIELDLYSNAYNLDLILYGNANSDIVHALEHFFSHRRLNDIRIRLEKGAVSVAELIDMLEHKEISRLSVTASLDDEILKEFRRLRRVGQLALNDELAPDGFARYGVWLSGLDSDQQEVKPFFEGASGAMSTPECRYTHQGIESLARFLNLKDIVYGPPSFQAAINREKKWADEELSEERFLKALGEVAKVKKKSFAGTNVLEIDCSVTSNINYTEFQKLTVPFGLEVDIAQAYHDFESLFKLKMLRSFSISRSKYLSGADDSTLSLLADAKNLVSLEVEGDFTGDGLAILKELPNLKSISLDSPFITENCIRELATLQNVENLAIHSDELIASEIAAVSKMIGLKSLKIRPANLDHLEQLRTLRNLRELRLEIPYDRNNAGQALTSFKELETLAIQYSTVGKKLAEGLCEMPWLKQLDLSHATCDSKTIETIRSRLTSTEILEPVRYSLPPQSFWFGQAGSWIDTNIIPFFEGNLR